MKKKTDPRLVLRQVRRELRDTKLHLENANRRLSEADREIRRLRTILPPAQVISKTEPARRATPAEAALHALLCGGGFGAEQCRILARAIGEAIQQAQFVGE